MPLYGNELDRDTNPFEAGLGRVVKLDKPGDFVGRAALEKVAADGPPSGSSGWSCEGRGIARHGYPVHAGDAATGVVTSGTQSPTLGGRSRWHTSRRATPSRVPMLDVEIRERAASPRACRRPAVLQEELPDPMVPTDLRYTKDHEWVRVDGDEATIGITAYAADQLGDIVFVELPDAGRALEQFAAFGVVESVKAVSDLFAPVSGEVVEANDELAGKPELVNSDPYGDGLDDPRAARRPARSTTCSTPPPTTR